MFQGHWCRIIAAGIVAVLPASWSHGVDAPSARSLTEPLVVLTASTHEIEVADPLLVRVTFINGTARPIPLYTRYSAQTGLVQFRMQIDGEWKYIRAYGQGQSSPRRAASELPSGETRATIESLFLVGDDPIFSEPGDKVIRAGVRCPPVEYWSEPLTIKVKPASNEKLTFLKAHGRGLSSRFWSGPSPIPFEFSKDELQRLPESQFRRQLLWDAAFYDWAGKVNGDVSSPAWRELCDLLPKLDEVNRGRFQLNIASIHRKHRRYEEALAALDKLADPTPSSIWLRGELERAMPAAPP